MPFNPHDTSSVCINHVIADVASHAPVVVVVVVAAPAAATSAPCCCC